jgi:acyl-CoA hydrolase
MTARRLQISPGTAPQATLMTLADKNDLGIHTQFMTDEIMHLFSRGVITNRYKGLNTRENGGQQRHRFAQPL